MARGSRRVSGLHHIIWWDVEYTLSPIMSNQNYQNTWHKMLHLIKTKMAYW
jgi:hypothetical protein